MEFNAAQKAAIDKIVTGRLARQAREMEREWRAERAQLEGEIMRLEVELRSERSLLTRIRQWLGR